MRVAGIVLAAGASTRMGRANKLLLEIDGETLVHRAVRRALDAGLDPVVVVTGHEQERVRAAVADLDVLHAHNPDPSSQNHVSFHLGLQQAADADAAIILLADMVRVETATIRTVATAPGRIVMSRFGDIMAPPMRFPRDLFDALAIRNGKQVAAGQHPVVLDWPADQGGDIDRPADLA